MKQYQLEYESVDGVWVLKRRREVKHIVPKWREYLGDDNKKHRMPVDDSYEVVGEWEEVE